MSLSIKTPSGRAVVAGLYDSKSTTQASQIYYDNKDTKIAVSNMQKALDYVLMNNNVGEEFENKGWFDRPLDDLEWSKADREDFFRTNFNSIKDHISGVISGTSMLVSDFVTSYNTYETNRINGTEEIARSFRDFIFENMCLSEDETKLKFKQELVQLINTFVVNYYTTTKPKMSLQTMYSMWDFVGSGFMDANQYNQYINLLNTIDVTKIPYIVVARSNANTTPSIADSSGNTVKYVMTVYIPKEEKINNTLGYAYAISSDYVDFKDSPYCSPYIDWINTNSSATNMNTYYDAYAITSNEYVKIENITYSSSFLYLRNSSFNLINTSGTSTYTTIFTTQRENITVKEYHNLNTMKDHSSGAPLPVYGTTKATDTFDKNVYEYSYNTIINGNDNYSIISKLDHYNMTASEIDDVVDELLEEDTYQVPNKELKPNTYSTDEVKIGDFLGKPLYRKIFRTTQALTTSNAVFSSIVVENAEIKKVDFICNTTTNGIWYISGQGRFNDDGKLYGRGLSNSGAINYIDVILEYTKVGE